MYEKEIYVIGGYSKLINKLKVNFPNLVWMDKNYFKVSNFDVFILSSYMSHADKYKIDSLGLEYSYISGSGYKEIETEIFEIIKSLDN